MTEPTEPKPRRTMADLLADDRRAIRDMRTVPNPQVPHPDALPRTRRVTRERAAEIRAMGVGRGSDADLAGDEQAVEIAEIEARWTVLLEPPGAPATSSQAFFRIEDGVRTQISEEEFREETEWLPTC